MNVSDICLRCGDTKVEVYRKDRDIYESVCRTCKNAANRAYKQRNAEKIYQSAKIYRDNNNKKLLDASRSYRESEHGKQIAADYYASNRDVIKEAARRNKTKLSKPEVNKISRDWCSLNKDRRKQIASNWKKRNKAQVNASTAARFAKRQKANVSWSNDFFISEAYSLAQLRTQTFGFPWEVDHIVPLRSELVSGLHCEYNLAVIPASDNLAKGNRWWPDMPDYTKQDLHELQYHKWLAEKAS